MSSKHVLAVDLDGTLTWTDTLYESILALGRNNPLSLFFLPFWLIKGLAFFKFKVAENSELDVTTLPYNMPLIDWLKSERANGKNIVLCTASNKLIAEAVSKHLRLFDDVIASDENTNLKSVNKRRALEDEYGEKGYIYAGNSSADIKVWAGSYKAIVVNATSKIQTKATQVADVSQIFPSETVKFSDLIKALRVHQWVKNMLLFIPFLAAHQYLNVQSLTALALSFISFSLCASSIYIINDLLDLESDRRHLRKRYRPFASAKLSIGLGIAIVPLLVGASFGLGILINKEFLTILMLYFILASAYSLMLKKLLLVDCVTLAILFTARIIAGGAAVLVTPSFWLITFSIFIFLSLAFVKRFAELKIQTQGRNNIIHGRGYQVSDMPLIQTLGISSGYLSVLVMSLYMNSKDVINLYAQPKVIWLALPILLFWISWIWLKASRDEMDDDPIIFAIKDKVSLSAGGLIALVFLYASNLMGI